MKLQKDTREWILDTIQELESKVSRNNTVSQASPELELMNEIENDLLRGNIDRLKQILIDDEFKANN